MQVVAIAKKLTGWDTKSRYEQTRISFRLKSLLTMFLCPLPLSASTLLSIFGSDKEQSEGHHYGRVYNILFRKHRYRPIKFLEIGIGGYGSAAGGASLLAWRAYFPLARLVACDICPRPGISLWRTRIYQADQSSSSDLGRLIDEEKTFDIILDDGSHINEHQIFSFETLIDHLSDNGIYVIEDIQTSFWEGNVWDLNWGGRHIDSPEFSSTCVGYFLELSKYLNYMEFTINRNVNPKLLSLAPGIRRISFEHNLIVVEKGRNDIPSNFALLRSRAPADHQEASDTPDGPL